MLLPHSYQAALALMLLSMMSWGSFANTMKLCPKFRFQLYYWDYVIGLGLCTLLLGFTAGSLGHSGLGFLADLAQTPVACMVYAFIGGVVFNVANLLLVAAIEIAGLAVAFPIGIGLALVIGAILNYVITPVANPLLLFGGVALVAVAIVFDAAAYRKREPVARATTTRGIVIRLVCGVLMGWFYPFVARALNGVPGASRARPLRRRVLLRHRPCSLTFPANLFLMKKPLDGKPPVDGAEYGRAPLGWHLAGMLGGAIWCAGGVANFVASGAHLVGPAVSYSIGQGATMVSACWGVFVWHEFAGAPRTARRYCWSSCLCSLCWDWELWRWRRCTPEPRAVAGLRFP